MEREGAVSMVLGVLLLLLVGGEVEVDGGGSE